MAKKKNAISIDRKEFRSLHHQITSWFRAEVRQLHRRLTDRGVYLAQRYVPEEYGGLRRSIRVLSRSTRLSGTNWYGSKRIYAAQRERGGRIHAKKAKALRFWWKKRRRWYVGYSVQQEGSHYMLRSAERLAQEANKIADKHFEAASRKTNKKYRIHVNVAARAKAGYAPYVRR